MEDGTDPSVRNKELDFVGEFTRPTNVAAEVIASESSPQIVEGIEDYANQITTGESSEGISNPSFVILLLDLCLTNTRLYRSIPSKVSTKVN